MPFVPAELTKEDCDQWEANKAKNPNKPKNPKTNYRVLQGTKTYKQIEKRCSTFVDVKSQNIPVEAVVVPAPVIKTKNVITKEICEQWKANKKKNPNKPKNPFTNYKISPDSGIYKNLDNKCKVILPDTPKEQLKSSPKQTQQSVSLQPNKPKGILSRKLTLEDCLYWAKNPLKNPISKKSLSEKSKILKEIQKQCKPLLHDHEDKNKPKSPVQTPIHSYIEFKSPEKSKSPEHDMHTFALHYPELTEDHFAQKLAKLAEFNIYKAPPYEHVKNKLEFNRQADRLCSDFEKTIYQYFVSHYISKRTPYKSILLYHGVGTGKTCSAITLAEGFLTTHSLYEEPMVWVIMPLALKNSFKEQIFSLANFENYEYLAKQCTGDLYIKMAQLLRESNKEKSQTKIKKLIKARYKLFTYDAFATFIETEYIAKNRIVKDKVIIVDEAHNIRSMSNSVSSIATSVETSEKRVYTALTRILNDGISNRLVLLSATPMYNKADDIYDLLYLLCLNDKRTDMLQLPFPPLFNEKTNELNINAVTILKKLASNYISYLKGKNPFTFAVKLSPRYLNLPLLSREYTRDSNNKLISPAYKNWLVNVDEGIVVSELGEKQVRYLSDNSKGSSSADENNSVFNNLQPMNIVYDDSIGEKGFTTFFTRTDTAKVLNVTYNKNYHNALYPDTDHLGKYSGKILNICNIIKNTKGIVVIYSGYIWSGIVPIAIALEHMGFNREGAENILPKADIVPDALHNRSKYCILSSENSEVMGNTSIDGLMKTINNTKNIDGSLIKVILITPVAGEGLSFYNVREMHIVEPWFHFNRVTQIIGRGIRNCRHQSLPLEERNVTVFMHGSIFPNNLDKETADIHAFRISSKKVLQSDMIEKIIRDNAVDCILMKNLNYFPQDLFELGKIKINTSQNKLIDYTYGNTSDDEPKCTDVHNYDIDKSGFRKDIYQHFVYMIQNRLRKIVLDAIHKNVFYISIEEIVNTLQFNKEIVHSALVMSVYPNIIIDGFILIPHEDGIHIIRAQSQVQRKLRISFANKAVVDQQEQREAPEKCKNLKLDNIARKNIDEATLALYMALNSDCYVDLVKQFIEKAELSAVDEFIANCLYQQGALISRHELNSVRISNKNKYIGYVNIFNTEFEPIINIDGKYRDLIDREKDELIARRVKISKPINMSQERLAWGVMTPITIKKTESLTNTFKILTPGTSAGLKTGMVCTSLQKPAQDKILNDLGVADKPKTKADYCHSIALQLLRMNRITIYPEWKPNII
jgi:hypothetical protein